MEESLLPGPQGKTPRQYDVDRGQHTESYIVAIRGNTVPPQIAPPVYFAKPSGSSKEKNVEKIELKERLRVPTSEDENADEMSTLSRDTVPVEEMVNNVPSLPLLDQGKPDDRCGYTAAELERFRNDPVWRTLRWLLLILFWLAWILMFLAAILIVIFSPRCAPKAAPNWWRNAVAYQVWTPSFQDSDGNGMGDFVGLTNRLESLRRLGVQAVWPNPFLLSDGFSDAIRDHLAVDSKLGVNDDGDKLIEAVHNKGMKMLISLPVAVTSNEHDWYYRSARASLPEYANFSNYYHWRKAGENSPFMSRYRDTNASYIHYENQPNWPILNWQSASVRQNMFDVMSYWIDKGIDGFYLNGIEYLARIPNGTSPNWPAIRDVLRDIRNHVDTYANESSLAKGKQIVLYASRDNALEDEKKALVSSGLDTVINYELGSVGKNNKICHHAEESVAGCVHEILSDVVLYHTTNDVPAMWEFGNPQLSRIASRVQSQQQAELLTMLQLLLPGTNSIYYGEEIGMLDLPFNKSTPVQRGAMQWDDSENAGFSSSSSPSIPVHPQYAENTWAKQYASPRSHLKTFQKLATLRKNDETLNAGQTTIGQLSDSGFTVVRYHNEPNSTAGKAYLGAFNFGQADVTLSIREITAMENKKLDGATVVISSSNAVQYSPRQKVDLSSGTVTLPPEQGVVFKVTS